MSDAHTHKWTHITDLPDDWQSLHSPELANYLLQWQEERGKLQRNDDYQEFLKRLGRAWAVETGVLERLYSINPRATLTLIEKGLDASLLTHEDTDQSPELVVAMIRDHRQALEALYQVVSGERSLTASYIKELHQVITAHQEFCDAKNLLGHYVQKKLLRGAWKTLPNHIELEDGSRFEWCPPEQVASEIDQLLAWHEEHAHKGVPPEIEAAWLHHRFILTHPFEDGNGRIARCLATVVFLKADWLPPVVTREDRDDYFQALKKADDGDLAPLVDLFGSLEQRAIREALSLSGEVLRDTAQIHEIIAAAGERLASRHQSDDERRRKLVRMADALHVVATDHLDQVRATVSSNIENGGVSYKAYVVSAGRADRDKAGHNTWQITRCAKALRYRPNFEVCQTWTSLVIDMSPYPKTEILFSFHGIGSGERGILGCAGMTYQKHAEYTEDQTKVMRATEVTPLSNKPFEFTHLDDPRIVKQSFRKWLERCVREGLRRWSESL